jgi:hypothetical protein
MRILNNEASNQRSFDLGTQAGKHALTLAYIDTLASLGRVKLPDEHWGAPGVAGTQSPDTIGERRKSMVGHIAESVKTDPRISAAVIEQARAKFMREREIGLHNDEKSSGPGLVMAVRKDFFFVHYAKYLEDHPGAKHMAGKMEINAGENVAIFRVPEGAYEETEVVSDDGVHKELKLIFDGASEVDGEATLNPNPVDFMEGIDVSTVIRIVGDTGDFWQNPDIIVPAKQAS